MLIYLLKSKKTLWYGLGVKKHFIAASCDDKTIAYMIRWCFFLFYTMKVVLDVNYLKTSFNCKIFEIYIMMCLCFVLKDDWSLYWIYWICIKRVLIGKIMFVMCTYCCEKSLYSASKGIVALVLKIWNFSSNIKVILIYLFLSISIILLA